MVTNIEYKPSDILSMIKEVIELDINHLDNSLLYYHYICNMVDFLGYVGMHDPKFYGPCVDILAKRFPEFRDWATSLNNKDTLETLINNTRNLLRINRPTGDIFPEIYNHRLFQRDPSNSSWWVNRTHSNIDTYNKVLIQKAKYLNLLISKLKENGQ